MLYGVMHAFIALDDGVSYAWQAFIFGDMFVHCVRFLGLYLSTVFVGVTLGCLDGFSLWSVVWALSSVLHPVRPQL